MEYEIIEKNLEGHAYILFYFMKSPETEKLLMHSDENTCCVDLSTSERLAKIISDKYKIEQFPALLYRKGIVYPTDNVPKRLAEIDSQNISAIKKFLDTFLLEDGFTVFIKGTIEKPYCKYTKQLVKKLQELSIHNIKDFDIFTDENMRYYLKIINSWNTYPMIYHNKKFIGGLDIFLEYLDNNYKSN